MRRRKMTQSCSAKLVLLWTVLTGVHSILQAADMGDGVPGNWRRSRPLSAIYLPTENSRNDRCNQQVVGIVTTSGSYVVTWTMASAESKPDQRVVISRSTDQGVSWSAVITIDGDADGNRGAASRMERNNDQS